MNKNELLHHALVQNQYLKNYDEAHPRESYEKVRNSFNSLFKKVCEYWNDEYSEEKEQLPVQSSSTWEKKGNWTRTNEWRKYRNTQIIKLYKEAKSKSANINSELFQNIAHHVGSTLPKVKQVISEYEFIQI
jgi:hypothetical protein